MVIKKMKLQKIEKEIIYLLAIKNLIDEMVNFEVIKLMGQCPDVEIHFNSMTHKKFFNIILVDFLSCVDKSILEEKKSYLYALASICENPSFNIKNSLYTLKETTENFIGWLNTESTVEKIWFSSMNFENDLSIKRIEFIKICGNISKHNFLRLSGVAKEIITIFQRNGYTVDEEQAYSIFEEFYMWFHGNIFTYHSSTIAEFLNNIRWGIYEYLQPEYNRSIVVYKGNNPDSWYKYTYPQGVKNSFVQKCYWNLMDEIRDEPCMTKFEVTKNLKKRY